MKYLGSKSRIAKNIVPIMLEYAIEHKLTKWVEPFVGGGNIIDKIPSNFKRIGYDSNPHAIKALIAIRDFANKLPERLTVEEYQKLKGTEPDLFSSWLRFVASFGGKFDNGYAREAGSDETTFIMYGKRNAIKQSPNLQGVEFIHGDYHECTHFKDSIIYCDPPYEGTTSYKTATMNYDDFWQWCRMMSISNKVFVSEYNAPKDFVCVWEGKIKTNFASQRNAGVVATEKLFTI